MKDIIKKYYHYICIVVIAIVSFCFYSYLRYPLLNSDDAWVVLMAHGFHLPEDLFYWNQSRGGNIVALIAQIFIRLFHFRAITAVSISEYLLLLTGVLCFSSLFKNKNIKILLAVLWFLPFQRFIDITRFFIGWEYSVIAIAVFLINKLWDMDKTTLKAKLLMACTVFTMIIAVWVLYNALFTIIVLLITLLIYNGKKLPHKNVILFSLLGGIISYFGLKFIYSFNTGYCPDCNKINNWDNIVQALNILYLRYKEVLLFQTGEWFVSLHTYLCLLFLGTLIYCVIRNKYYKVLIKDKWIAFFLLDFCVFYGIYLLSNWVLINEMGRWYYVACYISLSMCVLLIFDRLYEEKKMKNLRFALYFVLFIGAISPIVTMITHRPKTLKPMEKYARELEPLQPCGIIAEWWNAYICSVADPDNVLATPHQEHGTWSRNPSLAYKVAQMDTVYLIQDMWLESFPEQTQQFGYKFKKDGEGFHIGDWQMCRYINQGKIK